MCQIREGAARRPSPSASTSGRPRSRRWRWTRTGRSSPAAGCPTAWWRPSPTSCATTPSGRGAPGRGRPSQQVTEQLTADGPPAGRAWPWPPWSPRSPRSAPRRAAAPGPALRRPRGSRRTRSPVTTPSYSPGAMADAEGFLRWASAAGPDARGYWPCQAVATHALSGLPAIDSGVTAVAGRAAHPRDWNAELLVLHRGRRVADAHGRADGRGRRRRCPGSDAVITGGTIDALCDQIVAGATEPGRRAGDLRGDAHRVGGVRGVGGRARADQLPAHDARALPHRRAEQRRRAVRGLGAAVSCAARPGPGPSASGSSRGSANRAGSPCGCPTSAVSGRPSRTTRCARTSTASTSGRAPRRSNGPRTRPAASSSGACSTARA